MIHKINCLQTIHYHVNMPNRKLTRCIIDSSLQDLIYPSSICFLVNDDMNSTSRKKSPTITTSRHLHKKVNSFLTNLTHWLFMYMYHKCQWYTGKNILTQLLIHQLLKTLTWGSEAKILSVLLVQHFSSCRLLSMMHLVSYMCYTLAVVDTEPDVFT